MRRLVGLALCLALPILIVLGGRAQTPTEPAPTVDRVGFPENYQTQFVPLFAFDRPDARQVRVVYGNHVVTNSPRYGPYEYGSVLVMETYRAAQDAQGTVLKDAAGRFIRDQLLGIFVMRKERGFGVDYKHNRTGEWEYVAYRSDRTHQTPPQQSFSCANCHLQAGASRDWVFRPNLIFDNITGSGGVPDGVLQHYSFVPGTIRVRAGAFVTWYNDDEVEHRLGFPAGTAIGDGPTLPHGATFRARFNAPGDYEVACRIHPTMRGRVIVDP